MKSWYALARRALALCLLSALVVPLSLPVAPALAQPGTPVPIGTVQGAVADTANGRTFRSPFAPPSGNNPGATPVTVRGVVYQRTLARTSSGGSSNGFFIQNTAATADADPTTSDGIFVFLGSRSAISTTTTAVYTPTVGDEIVLSGLVGEFFNLTQLTSALTVEQVITRELNIDAVLPAFDVNPPANSADADRYWERREGMRGSVPAGSVATSRDEFGGTEDAEVWLVRPDSPIAQRANPFERLVFRDPHPLDDVPSELFDNGNGYRFMLSSLGVKATANDNTAKIAMPRPLSTLNITLTGGIYFSFEKYSVAVAQQPAFTLGPDPAANGPLPFSSRAREYSVAAYNVENLYDFRDDPFDGCDFAGNAGCPGVRPPFDYVPASTTEYTTKVEALADQIITDLGSPDLILTQEAEDQDICTVAGGALACGTTDNADGKPDTLQELALAIAARGGPAYDAAYDRNGADDRGIVSAFLFRTDRVQLLPVPTGDPVLSAAPTVSYRGAALPFNAEAQNPKALNAVLPSDVVTTTGTDGSNVFTRAPQVGLFRIFREAVGTGDALDLYAVSNHFSSTPQGRVGQRQEQANYNAAIARAIQATDPDALILVGGDLNVFPRPDDPFSPGQPNFPSDQLRGLYEAGLRNLYDTALAQSPSSAYSYIFQGQAQVLDHLFVSPALGNTLQNVRYLSINSGYQPARAGNVARGQSDHNPPVARFTLADPVALSAVATYDTGLGEDNAEIIDLRGDRAVLTSSDNGSVDILDASALPELRRLQRVNITLPISNVNSAAIHPTKDLFLVATGEAGAPGYLGAYRLSDGTFLVSTTVGIQPDSVDIAPDGNLAVVANEAEGSEPEGSAATGSDGGPGSLSVINLSSFDPLTPTVLTATNVALPQPSGVSGLSTGRFDDLARLPITNAPETLEPETVTFSPDSQFAYVSLQENNGVVRLRLADNSLTYFGLGQTTHAADIINGGGYVPTATLTAFREPDGIALSPDGQFFVTADEGDTRPSAGSSGVRGGRTVSVFNAATGALLGDTGSQLDDIAAARGVYPDNRSNRGGSEPEVLDLAAFGGRTIVAVGLERANVVALIDVTTPTTPTVFQLIPTGAAPEGVKLVTQNGALFVAAASEVAGTVTVATVPVGALALTQRFSEDTPLALTDLSLLSPAIAGGAFTVTLQLANPQAGTLAAPNVGGAIASYNAATGQLTATGPVSDVNGLLGGVVFTPALNFAGSVSVTVSVLDQASPVTGTISLIGSNAEDRRFFPVFLK
jgi:predicted extracellular nuclease